MDQSHRRDIAAVFARCLDRTLRKALFRASDSAFHAGAATGVTVEQFLATLHAGTHGKLRRYFKNAEVLASLPQMVRKTSAGHPGAPPLHFVAFEDSLSQLLWNAARIAKALKKKSAGLQEFVAALWLDDQIMSRIKVSTGLEPNNDFLGPLPHAGNLERPGSRSNA